MKVLVIGAGNMGLTYAKSIAKSGYLEREDLLVYDKSADLRDALKKADDGFEVADTLEESLPSFSWQLSLITMMV